jgi:hypothetical protein
MQLAPGAALVLCVLAACAHEPVRHEFPRSPGLSVELSAPVEEGEDVVYKQVRIASEGESMLLGVRLGVFDDDGDGIFEADELRGTAFVTSAVPVRAMAVGWLRVPGSLVRPWLHAEADTTQGLATADWAHPLDD